MTPGRCEHESADQVMRQMCKRNSRSQKTSEKRVCFCVGTVLEFFEKDTFCKERRNATKMRPKVFIFSVPQPAQPLALCAAIILCLAQAGLAQTAPTITRQPANQSAVNGGVASFSVAVAGPGPFFYQWQFNGANLPDFIITVAGNGAIGYSGDGGAATNAALSSPVGLALDAYGNLFIADDGNNRIRKVDANGIITTVAGGGSQSPGDGGAATHAFLSAPCGVAVDTLGNLFIADSYHYRIRKVDPNGIITTVAGNGTIGYSGDGNAATNAELNQPFGVAVDVSGHVFISDSGNQRIREVGADGIIITIAGDGTQGYRGDGGPATNAELNYPICLAPDASGNLFIADSGNNRIRQLGTNGLMATVAGNGVIGDAGDGGAATNASLNAPFGVAVDMSGNLFIADMFRLREVGANGLIATLAGNGTDAYSGDGGPAIYASLNDPWGVAVDASGNVFIADSSNARVRKVSAVDPPTLTLQPVSTVEAGSYSVVVSNAYGSVTSSVATLTMLKPPTFTSQPQSQTVTVGDEATFSVTVEGTPPFYYQWFFDPSFPGSAALTGQTNSTLTIETENSLNEGGYGVVVSNLYGSVTSSVATLGLVGPPNITSQPQSQTVTVGSEATFSVTVDGFAPLHYQWFFYPTFFGSTALSDQTNSTLTIEAESSFNEGTYQVVVTNLYGSMTSSGATLSIQAKNPFAPVWKATMAPQLLWRCVASSADGTVIAAVSDGDFVYSSTNSGEAWVSNNVPSTYLTSVAVSHDGTVWVAVGDGRCCISTNAGAIWQLNTNIYGARAAAFSPDGTRLVVFGEEFYTSTNSGATWAYVQNYIGPTDLAMSGDGSEILASSGAELELSTNSGASWFADFDYFDHYFSTVTCSADGSKLTACYHSLSIFLSTNAGANWSLCGLQNTSEDWSDAASVDGSRLVAVNAGVGIYTSTDFGASWTSNNGPALGLWQVVCSQDGTRLTAIGEASSGFNIYTAQWPPNLNIQPAGGSIVLSWPAPSTGFVLQQSVDSTLTNWATVPITPITSNYYHFVTLPAASNAMMFRLTGPSF
jgi:sugar lactone lactonase YvrE